MRDRVGGDSGNPGTFYFGAASNDWTAPQNADLWQDERKTPFDPCPAGWRVPKCGEKMQSPWQAYTTVGSAWENTGTPQAGRRLPTTISSLSCWYAGDGWRSGGNVRMADLKAIGYLWASTSWGTSAVRPAFDQAAVISFGFAGTGRGNGYPVRCIRE